jgi:hypothetical protein
MGGSPRSGWGSNMGSVEFKHSINILMAPYIIIKIKNRKFPNRENSTITSKALKHKNT